VNYIFNHIYLKNSFLDITMEIILNIIDCVMEIISDSSSDSDLWSDSSDEDLLLLDNMVLFISFLI